MRAFLAILVACVLLVAPFDTAYAAPSVIVNGTAVAFDAAPLIYSGRTLVPLRALFEALGAEVGWSGADNSVTATRNSVYVWLRIGSRYATCNGKGIVLDVAPRIVHSRTFVPLRFVSEALGATVAWNGATQTVTVTQQGSVSTPEPGPETIVRFAGVKIGDLLAEVTAHLGSYARQELSKYGFQWNIYNPGGDFKGYVQVGVKDGRVVALSSNAHVWKVGLDVEPGMTRTAVRERYGQPLSCIVKGNTQYAIANAEEQDVYLLGGNFVTFYYDRHDSYKVMAVNAVEHTVELALNGYYGASTSALARSLEKQMHDQVNVERVKRGLAPLAYDAQATLVARNHSEDMRNRGYFSHTNLAGKSPFDRMTATGISYLRAGENLQAGASTALEAHVALMNSSAHRANVLGDYQRLGVGVALGGDWETYFTQALYTPR